MRSFIVSLCLLVAGAANASQPECVGDRHYDETGQCCPIIGECPETTTTTTLPAVTSGPQECPTVTCDCTDSPIVVSVECPAAPRYIRCKRVTPSAKYPGGIRCPGKRVRNRVFVPVASSSGAFLN